MTSNDDTLNQTQIAEVWQCARTAVLRARDDLGEPADPQAPRPRWTKATVVRVGRIKGFLDDEGKPTPRHGNKPPVPYPHQSPTSGKLRVFYPDAAAMLGISLNTLHAWVNRGKLKADEKAGRYPAFHLPTLRRCAKSEGRHLDEKARRPAETPESV
ncbi:helix-turn-helix domain-containing protein [Streptomyces sp. NBC_01304]|uniref:helix-turn-helix domain-containing protein n=1 Tax=Streptomyces sp. NBC_01304 TaxID=2903818 RepID=UPI002E137579|nr:helix-turn-helix domain-containing protein [Streptomyces sp. NBC_01304]